MQPSSANAAQPVPVAGRWAPAPLVAEEAPAAMPPELYDRWVAGPAREDRLRGIFAIAGRKLSSDEAAWVWQKLQCSLQP